jgi:hypothetical protein
MQGRMQVLRLKTMKRHVMRVTARKVFSNDNGRGMLSQLGNGHGAYEPCVANRPSADALNSHISSALVTTTKFFTG